PDPATPPLSPPHVHHRYPQPDLRPALRSGATLRRGPVASSRRSGLRGTQGFMFERYTEKARRVIFFARYEASQFGSPYIETEHLLLGLLREDKCFAAEILHERGLRLSAIREELQRSQSEKLLSNRPKESSLLAEFSRDLTQAAMDNALDPLIGREGEL